MFESLLDWSEPKEIQTKYGPRLLRKAEPTEKFWETWREKKAEMKAVGISCSKNNLTGAWEVAWWMEISAEVKQARAESVAQSHAVSAEIDLPHPEGLDYYPFQKAGIRYGIEHPNVLIADEMGLGKSIQTIGIINVDETIKSVLIICPKSLKLNWLRECQRWLVRNLSVSVVDGKILPETDICIVNYDGVIKHEDAIKSREWDMVVLDEAHLIKNRKTRRSKAIKGYKPSKKEQEKGMQESKPIAARRHIRLTGTPIVNRPQELQNLIDDLNPDFAGWAFLKRYTDAHQIYVGRKAFWDFSGASNLDELQTRLRSTLMIRRLKSEVLTELPRKIRQIIELEPETGEQKRAVASETKYEAASEERLSELRALVELSKAESDEAYQTAAANLKNASQMDFTEMARLRHETAVAKIPLVADFIRAALEDDAEKKIIVAVHHHDMGDGLLNELAAFSPVILTGETKETDRQAAVDRFQNDPQTRVFIGSIQAAGVGITLTAASHVIFGELDWVPGVVSQFEDRPHRIGQTETVLIQHLVLAGSIDARMAKTIIEKQEVIDSALDINHPERTVPIYQPERTVPIYQPKQTAATSGTKKDLIAQLAKKITPEQVAAVHSGLRILAGLDMDHASELNDAGFNKIDNRIGHELARCQTLTSKQAILGGKLLRKYWRQLGEDLNETIKGISLESERKQ